MIDLECKPECVVYQQLSSLSIIVRSRMCVLLCEFLLQTFKALFDDLSVTCTKLEDSLRYN